MSWTAKVSRSPRDKGLRRLKAFRPINDPAMPDTFERYAASMWVRMDGILRSSTIVLAPLYAFQRQGKMQLTWKAVLQWHWDTLRQWDVKAESTEQNRSSTMIADQILILNESCCLSFIRYGAPTNDWRTKSTADSWRCQICWHILMIFIPSVSFATLCFTEFFRSSWCLLPLKFLRWILNHLYKGPRDKGLRSVQANQRPCHARYIWHTTPLNNELHHHPSHPLHSREMNSAGEKRTTQVQITF